VLAEIRRLVVRMAEENLPLRVSLRGIAELMRAVDGAGDHPGATSPQRTRRKALLSETLDGMAHPEKWPGN
jgi:hypothetical protein